MRATKILLVVAGVAFTGGAVYGQSQEAADAAPDSGQAEYRGELYPDPETGCIEIPDEPGLTPRLRPYRAPGGEAEDLPPADETHPERGYPPGTAVDERSDHDLELYRKPWPVCEEPDVYLVVTEDGAMVVDIPDAPGR